MVPDVNKYAIRNGRVAAAWDSGAAATESIKTKRVDTRHNGELILLVIAKNSRI